MLPTLIDLAGRMTIVWTWRNCRPASIEETGTAFVTLTGSRFTLFPGNPGTGLPLFGEGSNVRLRCRAVLGSWLLTSTLIASMTIALAVAIPVMSIGGLVSPTSTASAEPQERAILDGEGNVIGWERWVRTEVRHFPGPPASLGVEYKRQVRYPGTGWSDTGERRRVGMVKGDGTDGVGTYSVSVVDEELPTQFEVVAVEHDINVYYQITNASYTTGFVDDTYAWEWVGTCA